MKQHWNWNGSFLLPRLTGQVTFLSSTTWLLKDGPLEKRLLQYSNYGFDKNITIHPQNKVTTNLYLGICPLPSPHLCLPLAAAGVFCSIVSHPMCNGYKHWVLSFLVAILPPSLMTQNHTRWDCIPSTSSIHCEAAENCSMTFESSSLLLLHTHTSSISKRLSHITFCWHEFEFHLFAHSHTFIQSSLVFVYAREFLPLVA